MTKKIWVVCLDCGSHNVRRDADVTWYVEDQKWELNAVYDQGYCDACGTDSSLGEVEIRDENQLWGELDKLDIIIDVTDEGWKIKGDKTVYGSLAELFTAVITSKGLIGWKTYAIPVA